ncbi:asparaginase, partial [Acidobacteriota bacterium]
MSKRPKVLVLTTGGTITMLQKTGGSLEPCEDAALLIEKAPELNLLAQIDLHPITNMDSSNLQPALWLELSRVIYQRMNDYDGFVVTHGTDTLCYTSAALSFMLQELPKPVVITGAQLPLGTIGTDGRDNLINAVRVATSDIAEGIGAMG